MSYVTLLSYDVKLAGPDPFGQVLHAELPIRGKAMIGEHRPGEFNYDGTMSLYFKGRDGEYHGWRWASSGEHSEPDPEYRPSPDLETRCLLLCMADNRYCFLVLRKVRETSIYERRGVALFYAFPGRSDFADEFLHWKQHCEEQELVLV